MIKREQFSFNMIFTEEQEMRRGKCDFFCVLIL
ncbi:hypothetical protein T11_11815 [Trichinella zimbabwensis]|uniref:Uncharacterized protein n=1 Tax=Trichinella zimbabwensis TaxID=268475 RepID=A0A0V1GDM6_9BILA|nr:hypothetical protein T11_11815 [Trichinella zimbabwensis]